MKLLKACETNNYKYTVTEYVLFNITNRNLRYLSLNKIQIEIILVFILLQRVASVTRPGDLVMPDPFG